VRSAEDIHAEAVDRQQSSEQDTLFELRNDTSDKGTRGQAGVNDEAANDDVPLKYYGTLVHVTGAKPSPWRAVGTRSL
jgi:hypothetical protein